MNSTVGVALITSLSTLAAGALASFTSLRIQRRQVNAQRETIVSEQEERENARRRQLRREAYVELLTCCDEASNALREYLDEKPPPRGHQPESAVWQKAERRIKTVGSSLNTVYLEGPEGVIEKAHLLASMLTVVLKALERLAEEHAGSDYSLARIANIEEHDPREPYFNAKLDFIDAARKALGDAPIFE